MKLREGAFRAGGRWNSQGVRAVYWSLDVATAILEIAVHKGFGVFNSVPHVLSEIEIHRQHVHTVTRDAVPETDWLLPGVPTVEQQAYGDVLLRAHRFVTIPSVVSPEGWNLIFNSTYATGHYVLRSQRDFVLDPRLVR